MVLGFDVRLGSGLSECSSGVRDLIAKMLNIPVLAVGWGVSYVPE